MSRLSKTKILITNQKRSAPICTGTMTNSATRCAPSSNIFETLPRNLSFLLLISFSQTLEDRLDSAWPERLTRMSSRPRRPVNSSMRTMSRVRKSC
ncbi:hypothetical protein FRC18_004873 [Serendipita sp. 400]|nr:hypothetical protein FRC18_004873 [Serendipita sp. 400]